MHELSIAQSIVTLAGEAAQGRRVTRINVEIGALSGVLADSVAFGFDLLAEGTPIEGAKLNILQITALARCDDCGQEFMLAQRATACSCGSFRHALLRGDELSVRSIELEPESV